jgi:hypothetical protein
MLAHRYNSAELVTINGEEWKPSPLFSFPLFIITAANPFSIKTSDKANQRRHLELYQFLQASFPSSSIEELVGQSQDKQWKEPSWAVDNITVEEALAVGRTFYQWAIFSINNGKRKVLHCWQLDRNHDFF